MYKIITDADEETGNAIFWSLCNNKNNLKEVEVYTNKELKCSHNFISMINFKDKSELEINDGDKIILLPNKVIIKTPLINIQEYGLYPIFMLTALQTYMSDNFYSWDYPKENLNKINERFILVTDGKSNIEKIVDIYGFVSIIGYNQDKAYYDIFDTRN